VLKAGLTLRNGLPLDSSYSSYRVTKMRDFPKDVPIIAMPNTGDPIGGLGEVGLSAASGAIANAHARATGRKPRNFLLNGKAVTACSIMLADVAGKKVTPSRVWPTATPCTPCNRRGWTVTWPSAGSVSPAR
jgi:hypothetical protein